MMVRNDRGGGLLAVSQNIRSLNTGFPKLCHYLRNTNHKPDLILVQETWAAKRKYNLTDYCEPIFHCRKGNGGGIGAWFSPRLRCRWLNDLDIFIEGEFESMVLQVSTDSSNLGVINVYKPPKSNINETVKHLQKLIDRVQHIGLEPILTGDFNINLLKNSNQSRTLIDWATDNGLKQSVSEATRIHGKSSTLIDCVFARPELLSAKVHDNGISDHLTVNIILSQTLPTFKEKESKLRFDKHRIESISKELKSIFWPKFFEGLNANRSALKLERELKGKIIKHCKVPVPPKKKIKLRSSTLALKSKLKKLRKLIKNTTESDLKMHLTTEYTNVNALYKERLKAEITLYQTEKLNAKNPRKLWEGINEITGRGKAAEGKATNLSSNDFLKYFSTIARNVSDTIQTTKESPLKYCPTVKCNWSRKAKLEKQNRDEIYKILKYLKPKKSMGHDEISSWLIKHLKHELTDPITIVINKMIHESKFPETWKLAKIKPLHKKGETDIAGNYRPISLLPCLSKVAEKVIAKQLYDHMEMNNLLPECQYGFRRRKSTTHAINNIIYEIERIKNEKRKPAIILMDFSKAFDVINHKILYKKMEKMGVDESLIKLLKSYLTDRRMYVDWGTSTSRITRCDNIGCPQGSVLGPLLYLIYTSSLKNLLKNVPYVLYADDTAIITDITTNPIKILEKTMNTATNHFNALRLKLNVEKTEILTCENQTMNLNIQGKTISTKTRGWGSRYLGVQINADLNWNAHVDNVITKARMGVHALSSLRNVPVTDQVLKVKTEIYNALVLSHLMYGNGSWNANLSKTQLQRLMRIQKSAIRMVHSKRKFDHTDPLFIKSNTLKIEDLISKGIIGEYISIKTDPSNYIRTFFSINDGRTRQKGTIKALKKGKTLAAQVKTLNGELDLINSEIVKSTKLKHYTASKIAKYTEFCEKVACRCKR